MVRILFFTITVLLSGCATNQLHFAGYSSEEELSKVKNANIDIDVIEVSGVEGCTKCTESSKMVWHAANYNGLLYEGFSKIPISDWSDFVRSSLISTADSSTKARIEIHRVFLKTWQNPQYHACQSEISVYINNQKYHGKAIVKIKGSGQELLRTDLAQLNPDALNAIRLSLRLAYLNAVQ
ncbi:hypothetical protein [Ectopseudomonas alcaliphila]|uniref:hypothetical protein n=1 Tax=Ectopseudomonas alcaliphila TaxID=101564 RepID=UPI002782ADCD|nr:MULTISPECIES: hypothetical protein [Pseudomonas]MDP9939002.1 hypothetical protein [Pseudomonas sp. 3400]MDR7011225.1 hypothetical protein [Pseudomonas alcaliphila]